MDHGKKCYGKYLFQEITAGFSYITETQEKLAFHSNRRTFEPTESGFYEKTIPEAKEDSNVPRGYNSAVKTATGKTATGPEFLGVLNEAVQPVDEILSTEDEIDMDIEDN